jgi:glycosyltransferase involved in cell wall biosynthesis
MLSTPRISVVMPVYNAEAFLAEALESVLNQTFQDFEYIVIDDGSTDNSAGILERYARQDNRIRMMHQENRGVIAALNRGCRLARGEYIARMDADDVSLPHRFERQVRYIERRPRIGIVGTWIHNVDRQGSVKSSWRPPTNPKTLEWTHFFGVCVAHPSVLMRQPVLDQLGFYRSGTAHIEDVDLWLRASRITEFANVPEILFKYRTWEGSVSYVRREFARESHVKRLTAFIGEFLGRDPLPQAVAGLRQTRIGPPPDDLKQIRLTAELIQELYEAFVKNNRLTAQERGEISWDAARRMAVLGGRAARFDTRTAASLLMRALKVNPRLLHPSAMIKGLQLVLKNKLAAGSAPARHRLVAILLLVLGGF